jgi:ribosomal subunit interface protein
MISLQITGRHFELDDKITEYVEKKIGRLDKYLPRNHQAIFGSVVLVKDKSKKQDNQFSCEVIIEVPGERVQATESTMNMYAAVDICEQKLKQQILRYKEKHEPAKNRRRMLFAKMLGRDRFTDKEGKFSDTGGTQLGETIE